MTGEAHFAFEMVPEAGVAERPPALASGTLGHCAGHLKTSGDIFAFAGYPGIWFDDHTFVVDLPGTRILFRVVARSAAEDTEQP